MRTWLGVLTVCILAMRGGDHGLSNLYFMCMNPCHLEKGSILINLVDFFTFLFLYFFFFKKKTTLKLKFEPKCEVAFMSSDLFSDNLCAVKLWQLTQQHTLILP